MAEEKTYLELSQAGGGSHKFYEVIVNGADVTIRYGRIGDDGQSKTKTYASAEAAQKDAAKKIRSKTKKGYAEAVMGVRKKRAVTSRTAMFQSQGAAPKPKKNNKSPLLWKFHTKASALGIFIDSERCWIGNQNGEIFALDNNQQVVARFKLPDGVKAIVADDDFLYAGCDDGSVYDLNGKVPWAAYEISEDIDIYWIDIKDGILAISDADGQVVIVNHEDESQWAKKSRGDKGWMVRCDEIGVYHGHSRGVTMYDWEDGSEIWSQPTDGWVGFGWQEESIVFASTANGKVHRFSKQGGDEIVYKCDAFLCSCAAAEDGKYVFAGDTYGYLYCFNEAGERLWKLNSGCGVAQSMQYVDGRLYIVTNQGYLGCVDVSDEAIENARAGKVPKASNISAPAVAAPAASAAVETTSDASGGVVVACYKDGSKLRVRVVSEGYNPDWNCQFPKNLREEGARFVVDEIRESSGGYYRAYGDIRKLTD